MGRKAYAVPVKKNRFMIILESRDISIQKLADNIGHTRQGISKAIHSEKMDPQMLENISKYLDVSPAFFTGKQPLLKLHEGSEEEYRSSTGREIDPSGYHVPSYIDYVFKEFVDSKADHIFARFFPEASFIYQAYIDIGKRGVVLDDETTTMIFDEKMIDENYDFLVPYTYIYMKNQLESIGNRDGKYLGFLQDIEEGKEEVKKERRSFWSLFDLIEPAEDPKE